MKNLIFKIAVLAGVRAHVLVHAIFVDEQIKVVARVDAGAHGLRFLLQQLHGHCLAHSVAEATRPASA